MRSTCPQTAACRSARLPRCMQRCCSPSSAMYAGRDRRIIGRDVCISAAQDVARHPQVMAATTIPLFSRMIACSQPSLQPSVHPLHTVFKDNEQDIHAGDVAPSAMYRCTSASRPFRPVANRCAQILAPSVDPGFQLHNRWMLLSVVGRGMPHIWCPTC